MERRSTGAVVLAPYQHAVAVNDAMTALQGKHDKTVESGPVRRFISVLGPGLITGASDDDPSGIGTYSQAGAQLGFSIGWTMLLTFPLMAAIQESVRELGGRPVTESRETS